MLLLRWLQYITGYVRFYACGGFGERFLNLCKLYGIPLWDVQSDGDALYATTTPQGYRHIYICAKKSGMRTRMCKKTGLPFLLLRLRRRAGLLVGAVLLLCSLVFLSGRIWVINVQGCNTIPEENILAAAERAGLHIGAKRSDLHAAQMAISAEGEFDSVAHIAMTVTGSCVEITVKEMAQQPSAAANDGTCHLVAGADAQVVVLEPYSGTPAVRRFDSVLQGQLLISGINRNRDDSVTYLHAAGYAVGRTEKKLTASARTDEPCLRLQTQKTVYQLMLFGKKIPLGKAPKHGDMVFTSEKQLAFGQKKMPVGIRCTRYSLLQTDDRRPTAQQLRLIAAERYLQSAMQYTQPRQRISETVAVTADKKAAQYTGTLACYENIGVEQPFTVDETDQLPEDTAE